LKDSQDILTAVSGHNQCSQVPSLATIMQRFSGRCKHIS
jgi:hypothetical protein